MSEMCVPDVMFSEILYFALGMRSAKPVWDLIVQTFTPNMNLDMVSLSHVWNNILVDWPCVVLVFRFEIIDLRTENPPTTAPWGRQPRSAPHGLEQPTVSYGPTQSLANCVAVKSAISVKRTRTI
jgi:hypothetical protein